MVDCTFPLLKSWETKIEHGKGIADIRVDEDLRSYSADVISRACFGSSYIKGKEIFLKLRAMQKAISKPNMFVEITGVRYAALVALIILLLLTRALICFMIVN